MNTYYTNSCILSSYLTLCTQILMKQKRKIWSSRAAIIYLFIIKIFYTISVTLSYTNYWLSHISNFNRLSNCSIIHTNKNSTCGTVIENITKNVVDDFFSHLGIHVIKIFKILIYVFFFLEMHSRKFNKSMF